MLSKRRTLLVCALALAAIQHQATAANYATCILDKMPGAQNYAVAVAVTKLCQEKFPGGFGSVEKGSGRGLFSFNSGAECTAKKASDVRDNNAASLIYRACVLLYDKPSPFDDLSARPSN